MGRFVEAPREEQLQIVENGDCLAEAIAICALHDDLEFAMILVGRSIDFPLWLKLCFQCASVNVLNFLHEKIDWDLVAEWDLDVETYIRILLSDDVTEDLCKDILNAVPTISNAVEWLRDDLANELRSKLHLTQ